MSFKGIIKRLAPPILLDMVRPKSSYGWFGDYPTWGQAKKECNGYDAVNILEKCKSALLKVKNGEAAYERDSVLFDHIQYSWPVLAGLLRCGLENGGRLHVLDFGGSLGSSYYQNRGFLSGIKEFSWSIVEQKHFVACGRENFEDGVLKFYETVDQCLKERRPNVLLLSCVLQYLEDPYAWIREFCTFDFDFIIVDLGGLIDAKDRITIQKVPPKIYQASYPCWLLNKDKVINSFSEKYVCLAQFDSYVGKGLSVDGYGFDYGGIILKRRSGKQ